jgi:hypothetical protein
MTQTIDQTPPPPAAWQAPEPPAQPKKKMRKLSWAIIIFNVIMALWIVGGTISAAHGANCATETGSTYLSQTDAQSACEAGTAIGAGIAVFGLLFLTMMVDVILGVIWFVTRKNHQH